ncbi:MAG: sigma-70 family RNA polymerase sigma factor [Bacteroidota bacterium]
MVDSKSTDFRALYLAYADRFQRWARKSFPNCPAEEIEDACQEAYMVVYQHWIEGKITTSFQALLFAVGKNKLRDKMKQLARGPVAMKWEAGEEQMLRQVSMETDQQDQHAFQANMVQQLLESIGEPCKSVLKMAFFADYAVESIAQAMGYESERVASARKSKCLRQLRNKLQEFGLNRDDLLKP